MTSPEQTPLEEPPRCLKCGGRMRPAGVVHTFPDTFPADIGIAEYRFACPTDTSTATLTYRRTS